MEQLRRLIVTPPLTVLLAMVILTTALSFIVWVLAGSGPMQKRINDYGSIANELSYDLIKWTKEV